MPQDIPLEASETLVFTPPSLANIENPPTFTLRAATGREKRFLRRLYVQNGITSHSAEEIRAEVLKGLKALWSEEAYEQHAPVIEAFWQAGDDFALQQKDDPSLVWSYDPEVEQAVSKLTRKVAQSWEPLGELLADNADFAEMSFALMVAVIVKSWTNLSVPRDLDRAYLTVDCAEAIQAALLAIEDAGEKDGLKPGTAWGELAVACTGRMYLDQEEAGNSASPSASPTPPESSTAAAAAPGPSPASKSRSPRTRKAA